VRDDAPPRYEDLPDLVTPEEAQRFLRIGRNAFYAVVKSGDLPCVRFGKLIRVPRAALLGKVESVA
jgi:excisionase family DNA binding protein